MVNYDLPWAIIRLIQRAGRVDRIGQKAEEIVCYSFLPADGVERDHPPAATGAQRLQENGEVVGTDEQFFEDDRTPRICATCTPRSRASWTTKPTARWTWRRRRRQIWEDATRDDPALARRIAALPDVVYSTREHTASARRAGRGAGLRADGGGDRRAGLGRRATGARVTNSQLAILRRRAARPMSRPSRAIRSTTSW